MRLLFVCTSPGARGPENHTVATALAMANAGHEVQGVARGESFIARSFAGAGLKVTEARFRNALDWGGHRALRHAIDSFRPDWLLAGLGHEYWPVMWAGRRTQTRVALFRHINARLKAWTRRAIPSWTSRFIAVSASLRTQLLLQGLPAESVQLVFNPIDVEHHSPNPLLRERERTRRGWKEEQVVVGYAGGLEASKGGFCLAEALNRAMLERPALRAAWAIPESAHDKLREVISPSLLDRHCFFGWMQDVRPFYALLDVLAVPSIWPEVFGRVAAEAQACGVPVLGSRIGGIPEALCDGVTGALVSPGDVGAWSHALGQFASLTRERREEMGRAAVPYARERFALPVVADALTAVLGT